MGAETLTAITTKIEAVQGDIVTVGGLIIITAAVVFGIRWLKAQFF